MLSNAVMFDVVSEVEDETVKRPVVRVRRLKVVLALDDRVDFEGEPADRVRAQTKPGRYMQLPILP